ncbi:MAG: PilZ domain-containing protein [Hyphomicrobiaceae bacterium]
MHRGLSQHEQRAFGRRESRIHAFVRVAGRSPEPCILRNFSEGGALVAFDAPIALPERFRLTVDAKGVDLVCEVRRRNGLEFGVKFIDEQADIETRLMDDAIEDPEEAEAVPPPILLGSEGLVMVVPGHELRRSLIS